MDALALVVWTVTFLSATVAFFCGALIVVLRVRRRRAAGTRWAISPPSYIRAANIIGIIGALVALRLVGYFASLGLRTLAWLKVKQPRYREGERGWEPKR